MKSFSRSKIVNSYNWEDIQRFHDSGKSIKDILEVYNLTIARLETAARNKLFIKNTNILKKLQKEKASEQMKMFWQKTPEEGRNRILRSQNSIPCKNVKMFLRNNGIDFIEEFNPNVKDRYFHIDIALPDKMIGIEINGSYHYKNRNCSEFTEYHLNRKSLIEQLGWKIIDIPTNLCFSFDKDYWLFLIKEIKNTTTISNFNYLEFKRPIAGIFCKCGKKIRPNRKKDFVHLCRKCFGLKRRLKLNITKEKLNELYTIYGFIETANKLNVSRSFLNKLLNNQHIIRKKKNKAY